MRNNAIIKIISLDFLFLITILSCKTENSRLTEREKILINIDSVLSNKPVHFSDLFSGFSIIQLETGNEFTINRIDNLKILDDKIYIFDGSLKSLFIFSKNGKFLTKICKVGRGPDEYLGPRDFDVNPKDKSIYLLDWDSKKIKIYSEYLFLKEINLRNRFSSFSLLEDNLCLYMPVSASHDIPKFKLIHLLNSSGNSLWEKLSSSDFVSGPGMVLTNHGGNFFKSNNDLKFVMHYCNTIFSINKQGIQPFIELNTRKYKLSDNDLKSFTYENFSAIELAKLNKLTSIVGYSENEDIAFFQFFLGFSIYTILYNFSTEETICSNRFVDDLTFMYPNFYKISNDKLISYVDMSIKLSRLKEMANSGKTNFPESVKNIILQSPELSNPIIILLDLKRD